MVVRRRYNWSKSYRCYNCKNSPMASSALSSSRPSHPPPPPSFTMKISQVNHASQVFPSFPLHLHLENSFCTSNLIKESLLLGHFPVIYIWLLATCPHSRPIFWPHPTLCLGRWYPDTAFHRFLEQNPYIWVLLMEISAGDGNMEVRRDWSMSFLLSAAALAPRLWYLAIAPRLHPSWQPLLLRSSPHGLTCPLLDLSA